MKQCPLVLQVSAWKDAHNEKYTVAATIKESEAVYLVIHKTTQLHMTSTVLELRLMVKWTAGAV